MYILIKMEERKENLIVKGTLVTLLAGIGLWGLNEIAPENPLQRKSNRWLGKVNKEFIPPEDYQRKFVKITQKKIKPSLQEIEKLYASQNPSINLDHNKNVLLHIGYILPVNVSNVRIYINGQEQESISKEIERITNITKSGWEDKSSYQGSYFNIDITKYLPNNNERHTIKTVLKLKDGNEVLLNLTAKYETPSKLETKTQTPEIQPPHPTTPNSKDIGPSSEATNFNQKTARQLYTQLRNSGLRYEARLKSS